MSTLTLESPPAETTPAASEVPRVPWKTRLRRAAAIAGGFFPFTLNGVLLLTLSYYAVRYHGLDKVDLLLLMAGGIGLTIVAVMLLAVLAAALFIFLSLRKTGPPATRMVLDGSHPQPTGLELPFPGWFPLVEIQWTWESEPGRPMDVEVKLERVGSKALELAQPKKRGIYSQIRRKVTVKDILRLCKLSWGFTVPHEVQMLPAAGHLDGLSLLARFVAGEDVSDPRGDPTGDRVDMRQYTRGDSPRTILWKVFARTRKLMVRVNERALTARPRACAYMASGPGDEAGAGLARVILERNLLGDGWRFGADGTPGATSNRDSAMEFLSRSGNAEAPRASHLERYLQEAAAGGFASVFIMVPPEAGPHVQRILQAARSTNLRVVLCVGLDKIQVEAPAVPAWRRWLMRSTPEQPMDASIEEIAARWGQGHEEILLVDRSSGNVYSDLHAIMRIRAERGKKKAG